MILGRWVLGGKDLVSSRDSIVTKSVCTNVNKKWPWQFIHPNFFILSHKSKCTELLTRSFFHTSWGRNSLSNNFGCHVTIWGCWTRDGGCSRTHKEIWSWTYVFSDHECPRRGWKTCAAGATHPQLRVSKVWYIICCHLGLVILLAIFILHDMDVSKLRVFWDGKTWVECGITNMNWWKQTFNDKKAYCIYNVLMLVTWPDFMALFSREQPDQRQVRRRGRGRGTRRPLATAYGRPSFFIGERNVLQYNFLNVIRSVHQVIACLE